MFAIHRTDLRKTAEQGLEAAEMWAGHFAGVPGPEAQGSSNWAIRLYDLAFFLFEMHENVAAHRLTEEQHARAAGLVSRVGLVLRRDFPGLALPARVEAAIDGLWTLLEGAAGLPISDGAASLRDSHSRVCWLRNVAHNAWHDLLWTESANEELHQQRRSTWRPSIVASGAPEAHE